MSEKSKIYWNTLNICDWAKFQIWLDWVNSQILGGKWWPLAEIMQIMQRSWEMRSVHLILSNSQLSLWPILGTYQASTLYEANVCIHHCWTIHPDSSGVCQNIGIAANFMWFAQVGFLFKWSSPKSFMCWRLQKKSESLSQNITFSLHLNFFQTWGRTSLGLCQFFEICFLPADTSKSG